MLKGSKYFSRGRRRQIGEMLMATAMCTGISMINIERAHEGCAIRRHVDKSDETNIEGDLSTVFGTGGVERVGL